MNTARLPIGVWKWARRGALLGMLAGPAWVQAQVSTGAVDTSADVFQGPGPSAVTQSDSQVRPSGVSVLVINQVDHEQRKATGFGQILSDPGGSGAVTYTTSRGDASAGATAEATARASFSDGLTIDRTDLTGRTGLVTVAVRYGGYAQAEAVGDNSAWGSVAMMARFGQAYAEVDTSVSMRDGVRTEEPLTDVPGATLGVFLLTTAFTWGEAIDLSFESFMTSASYTAGPFESHSSAAGSGFWDGIRSVSVDGAAVRDFQLSSLSGYDYRLPFGTVAPPVPEPGMAAAMALGLVVIGLGARRRRGAKGE